jgi:hypothetical protein
VVGLGNGGPRRVDKQGPSQVKSGHSRSHSRTGWHNTDKWQIPERARISGEKRHESTFITGRRGAAASLVIDLRQECNSQSCLKLIALARWLAELSNQQG